MGVKKEARWQSAKLTRIECSCVNIEAQQRKILEPSRVIDGNKNIVLIFLLCVFHYVRAPSVTESMFARMIPSHRSGEFFASFAWGEKFAGLFGPLLFALATDAFGGAQPAILSIIPFFLLGGYLLTRVDVDEGLRAAREAERAHSM